MSLSLSRFGAPHTAEEIFVAEGLGRQSLAEQAETAQGGRKGEEQVLTESAAKVAEGERCRNAIEVGDAAEKTECEQNLCRRVTRSSQVSKMEDRNEGNGGSKTRNKVSTLSNKGIDPEKDAEIDTLVSTAVVGIAMTATASCQMLSDARMFVGLTWERLFRARTGISYRSSQGL
jgi:hypothetical protein